jgi:hypothetical protein
VLQPGAAVTEGLHRDPQVLSVGHRRQGERVRLEPPTAEPPQEELSGARRQAVQVPAADPDRHDVGALPRHRHHPQPVAQVAQHRQPDPRRQHRAEREPVQPRVWRCWWRIR